ncbi:MAG: shikimate dehydrogenase [Gemmatimonadota bacterium]|nr:MAG: shikimate dehydrogenase [Gemmatimonadota bacterium]
MSSAITSRTRVLALLGDPVEHSLSPVVQNAAFRETGVDGVYVALTCSDEDLPGFVGGIARAGGGGNVTLPHKEKAAPVLDVSSEAVRRTGACNTFWGVDGKVHGDNTDVEGFGRALRTFLGRGPDGFRVLVLGAGGAARAALVSLLDAEVSEICLLNRTVDRALAVSRRIGGERVRVVERAQGVEGLEFDLVVNTTRLGLSPDDPLPVDLRLLSRAGAVMDLVYGPEATPFVRAAEALGIRATDGMEMLVQQGAVSFERWWDRPAPVQAMRGALRGVGRA